MNNVIYTHIQKVGVATAVGGLGVFPYLASAQGFASDPATFGTGSGNNLGVLINNLAEFFNDIILPALLAIGFVVFVWGIFQYFIVGGANDEAKEKGKSLMIYATLGFVFIVIFWGLVNFLSTTIGLEKETLTIPNNVKTGP